MKKFTFLVRGLNICSLNRSHDHEHRKTNETRAWLYALKVQMLKHQDEIKEFRQAFDPKKHFLSIDYFWFLPKRRLFTAKGHVNTRSGDWSNFPKLPDDLIFNDVLQIDDGHVCKGSVYRLPYHGDEHAFKIVIHALDLELLHSKAMAELPEALCGNARI